MKHVIEFMCPIDLDGIEHIKVQYNMKNASGLPIVMIEKNGNGWCVVEHKIRSHSSRPGHGPYEHVPIEGGENFDSIVQAKIFAQRYVMTLIQNQEQM
ncbi:MAG: hypothetical protein QHG98_07395 [Methanothrix sp.]|jgi:hypothetical protein|nr:hypothetical protein [Methanothrix sp.]